MLEFEKLLAVKPNAAKSLIALLKIENDYSISEGREDNLRFAVITKLNIFLN